jgi:uncharacterized membrane protein YdjX (TVP38/TMEM64 family)
MTVASIVFSVLYLNSSSIALICKNSLLFSLIASLLLILLCVLTVWFILKEKEVLSKTLFSAYILILFCSILIFIFQKTGFFEVIKSAESLQEYLKSSGGWMLAVYIILQYLQVIILPIPSVVSTVAGVALFGPFYALLYSLVGIILGSFTGFLIGRKVGYKAVAWMIGKDTLEKWQNKLKGKDNLFLTIMFLLPMFPDDVLCFIAGLSSMSTKYFLCMITISRLITVSGTCYSFNFIPFNTWWGLLIWGAFFLAVILIFVFVYRNMDKIQQKLGKYFKSFCKKGK